MSVHVRCNWDGKSDPTNLHVDAVAVALAQNHAHLRSRWTPLAFAILNPADSVMHVAAQILDTCEGKPGSADLDAAVERCSSSDRTIYRNFLERVFKQLEELLDE